MLKILLTGGFGYLGTQVVRELIAKGHEVMIFDNCTYYQDSIGWRKLPLNDMKVPTLTRYNGDVGSLYSITDAFKFKPDVVIHLAAIVGDEVCNLNQDRATAINALSVVPLMQLAPRLIFASTCSVYGDRDTVMTEEDKMEPISHYGITKQIAEGLIKENANKNTEYTIVRFPTLFGMSDRPRFDLVVNRFVAQAYFDGQITVHGTGNQMRPFCHVLDAAKGLVKIVEGGQEVRNQTFHIGGVNSSIEWIAKEVMKVLPKTHLQHLSTQIDNRNYEVSFRKAKDVLGFSPLYSIELGIRQHVDAFRAGKITDYNDPLYHNANYLKAHYETYPVI